MTSQSNTKCVCGHSLDEHSQISYHAESDVLCDYSNCDCQGFIATLPAAPRDEAAAQHLLNQLLSALQSAATCATNARQELSRVQAALPNPIEMDKYMDIVGLAFDSLTHANTYLGIVIEGLEAHAREEASNAAATA